MATEIPAHADTKTKEGKAYWARWAAVGDAKDAERDLRRVVNAMRDRWASCRRAARLSGRTCGCGRCPAAFEDAQANHAQALLRYQDAIREFKGQ